MSDAPLMARVWVDRSTSHKIGSFDDTHNVFDDGSGPRGRVGAGGPWIASLVATLDESFAGRRRILIFATTRDKDVHFHQLDEKSGSRIRYRKVSEKTGREVDADDIADSLELVGVFVAEID